MTRKEQKKHDRIRRYRKKHKAEISAQRKVYRAKNKVRLVKNMREWRRNLKQDVMNAYGGACVCCDETFLDFLNIDHADGSGKQHRIIRGGGSSIYWHLKQDEYPKDGRFRVLCFNCNLAVSISGACRCPGHKGVTVCHIGKVDKKLAQV